MRRPPKDIDRVVGRCAWQRRLRPDHASGSARESRDTHVGSNELTKAVGRRLGQIENWSVSGRDQRPRHLDDVSADTREARHKVACVDSDFHLRSGYTELYAAAASISPRYQVWALIPTFHEPGAPFRIAESNSIATSPATSACSCAGNSADMMRRCGGRS